MVKTPDEIVLMRKSGRLLASVFEMLDEIDLVGMSTMQINDLVERYITVDLAARPASKGQYGFQFVLKSQHLWGSRLRGSWWIAEQSHLSEGNDGRVLPEFRVALRLLDYLRFSASESGDRPKGRPTHAVKD